MAEKDSQRVKSAEELALEQQAAIAKLQNDIAQGQADTQKAAAQAQSAVLQAQKDQFKGPDIAALPGNITSDGTFIESRILARQTQGEAFTALGKALHGSPIFAGKRHVQLVLYNPADVAGMELYLGMMIQLALLEEQYQQANDAADEALHPPADPGVDFPDLRVTDKGKKLGILGGATLAGVATALSGVASGGLMAGYAGAAILRTAIDIASLFRVNTDYKNFDVAIDDTALAAELKKVLPAGWKLWYPAAFPVNMVDAPADVASAFLDIFHRVLAKNKRGVGLAGELDARIKKATDAAAAEKDMGKQHALQQEAARFTTWFEPIATLNTAFIQLQSFLSNLDPASRTTPLTLLLRAERLAAIVKDGYVIRLSAVSKGSNKVTQRLWSSAVIRHSAGTELSCVVFAPDGEIVFADTQLKYTPYIKADDIRV